MAGPFVVETIVGNTVHLRTTRNVPGQDVRHFPKHIGQVARCTTISDVLEKLLYTAQVSVRPSPDHMAAQHSDSSQAIPLAPL